VVRLSGTVQSYRRAAAAIELASSWQGVLEVVNDLQIVPPGSVSDELIADNLRVVLDASEDIAKEAITVSVTSGVAVLSGTVADTWQFVLAEDIARSARGVRDVRNQLVVNLFEVMKDEDAAREIRDTLRRECGTLADDVRVAVSGPTVVLSGTVGLLIHKAFAREVARRYGILDVRNEIRIVPAD